MSDGHDETIAASLPAGGGGDGFGASGVVAKRYQIVRWLGGGGMGRVYEALDLELDERVALKVLRSGMPDEAIERFRREVKLTRRIVHRNVARMFDIGEHAGDRFLTMELIDGPSLAQELGAPMTWARLREVGLQICAGLGAAHASGVVHRDLKPDNVLVETATGRIVITDFGIARTGEDANVTRIGEVIGTPRYMAPEQLAGEPLDGRADLFALGVMMYELATGTRPWAGDNAIAIAVAQATKPPRPMSGKVPAELAAIVERCLALAPADRPASATEIGEALERIATQGTTRPSRPTLAPAFGSPTPSPALPPASGATTVAVLPFEHAPADAYLAEGVREDLIDTLSTSATLRVRPAGIVAAGSDPRAVGHALEVDHVVVGSLRRTPDGLRVMARLVGIADGFQIWAQRRTCTDAEILVVSEGLAKGIATALSTRAVTAERPTDSRAVDLYLRGRAELRRFWGEHAVTAANLLAEAVAIAPTSVPIITTHAYACAQAYGRTGDPALLPRARETVEHALATGHGDAFLAAAVLAWALGDSETMASRLGTALTRAPMSAPAHELAGRLLLEVGPLAEGRKHFEIALGLEPQRQAAISLELARAAAYEGDYATVDLLTARLSADPDPAFARIGAMAEARLNTWRRDLGRSLAASNRLTSSGGSTSSVLVPNVSNVLVQSLSDYARGAPFDEVRWQNAMTALAHNVNSVRMRLITYQRAVECMAICGRLDDALDALTQANRWNLIDINWIDRCALFRDWADEPRWRAQREVLAARAERVLSAFRSANA